MKRTHWYVAFGLVCLSLAGAMAYLLYENGALFENKTPAVGDEQDVASMGPGPSDRPSDVLPKVIDSTNFVPEPPQAMNPTNQAAPSSFSKSDEALIHKVSFLLPETPRQDLEGLLSRKGNLEEFRKVATDIIRRRNQVRSNYNSYSHKLAMDKMKKGDAMEMTPKQLKEAMANGSVDSTLVRLAYRDAEGMKFYLAEIAPGESDKFDVINKKYKEVKDVTSFELGSLVRLLREN